jgi:hypothetical protein
MHAKTLYTFLVIIGLKIGSTANLGGEALRIDIDAGLPIGDALYSLMVKNSRMIATPLTSVKNLERADTFLLKNESVGTSAPKEDVVLYVESKASRQGGTYKISRMSLFKLKDMDRTVIKNMIFFRCFDLEKLEGHK